MSTDRVVDTILEAAIVPSFTRLGPAVRSRLAHWRPLESYDLSGATVLVTGATSGLGRHTALRCAQLGARVLVNGRDPAKVAGLRDEIASAARTGDRVEGVVADLAEPEAVERLAADVLARTATLDVVVHNAGALSARHTTNTAGVETTVAAQVLGPFLLTSLLLPALQAAAPGRVITVASGGMYTASLTVDELQMAPGDYRGSEQYARAKRAQVTLNELWSERVRSTEVVFHAMHPGWTDTPGLRRSLPMFRMLTGPLLRDLERGADTVVWLAADERAVASSGDFWLDRAPRPVHRLARTRRADTPEQRAALWSFCVAHTSGGVVVPR